MLFKSRGVKMKGNDLNKKSAEILNVNCLRYELSFYYSFHAISLLLIIITRIFDVLSWIFKFVALYSFNCSARLFGTYFDSVNYTWFFIKLLNIQSNIRVLFVLTMINEMTWISMITNSTRTCYQTRILFVELRLLNLSYVLLTLLLA